MHRPDRCRWRALVSVFGRIAVDNGGERKFGRRVDPNCQLSAQGDWCCSRDGVGDECLLCVGPRVGRLKGRWEGKSWIVAAEIVLEG